MSVGTGTAIALGIGAGTQVLGGVLGSRAAGKAAKQQQAAAQQALQLAQQQYGQARSDLAPYAQLGTQALGPLRALAGLPSAGGGAGMGIAPGESAGMPVAPGGNRGFFPLSQVARPAPSALPAQSPGFGSATGMVMLRAPSGQTQAVPGHMVDFFLSRGATRV